MLLKLNKTSYFERCTPSVLGLISPCVEDVLQQALGAGPYLIHVACDFCLLHSNKHKKSFSFTFLLIFCYTVATCESCLYF